MKAIWNEFFYIPKYGKIREKVMLARGVVTIVVVLVCLAAMGFTAYAYFSDDVSSQITAIQAAKFDLTVTVAGSGENAEPIEGENNTYSLTPGEYTVTLTRTDDSNAKTGFCAVDITIGERTTTLHTVQINATDSPLTFALKLSESATVSFTPNWGTSAKEDGRISQGNAVNLSTGEENS